MKAEEFDPYDDRYVRVYSGNHGFWGLTISILDDNIAAICLYSSGPVIDEDLSSIFINKYFPCDETEFHKTYIHSAWNTYYCKVFLQDLGFKPNSEDIEKIISQCPRYICSMRALMQGDIKDEELPEWSREWYAKRQNIQS